MERFDYTAAGRLAIWDSAPDTPHALVQRIEHLLRPHAGASIEADADDLYFSDDEAVVALTSVLDKLVARGCPTLIDLDFEERLIQSAPALTTDNLTKRTSGRLVGPGFEASTVAGPDLLDAAARLLNRVASPADAVQIAQHPLPHHLRALASPEEDLLAQAIGRVFSPAAQARLQRQPLLSDLAGSEREELAGNRVDLALDVGSARWVFEVDGEQHRGAGAQAHDDERDRTLEEAGWRVFRVPAGVVRNGAAEWLRHAVLASATPEERAFLDDLATGALPPRSDSPAEALAYTTIVRPHVVHRALRGLVQLIGLDLLPVRTGSPVRILAIEEDVPALAEAFRQLLRLWRHLHVIAPETPALPTIHLDVLGNETAAAIPPTEGLSVRRVEEPEGTYDLALSHAFTLQTYQEGARERAASAQAQRRVRLRSSRSYRDRRTLPWSPRLRYDLEDLEQALRTQATDAPRPLPRQKYEALRFFLQQVFRKNDFWDGQARVIARLLQNRPAVVLLPTGGGKSLTYQFSGLLLPGVTLVVDPLVALMADQVENLRHLAIDQAGAISSLQDAATKGGTLERMERGELAFVFVAPERLQMPDFRSRLRALTAKIPVSLGVIDEAHCVSEWGHDFRPSYLHMGRNLQKYAAPDGAEPPTLVGLTGTASFAVLTDIQVELDVRDEEAVILPTSFDRKELTFHVRSVPSSEKDAALRTLREELPRIFRSNPQRFFEPRGDRTNCGIVFCPHVNGSLGVVKVAGDVGHGNYYAGSKPKRDGWRERSNDEWQQHKMQVQHDFKHDRIQELVATHSFGMGIDKPNVRYTIHYTIPHSVEAYYQEAGRAGRDGRERSAHCFILYSDDNMAVARAILEEPDHKEASRLLEQVSWPDRGDLLHQLWFLFNSYRDRGEEKQATLEFWRQELAPEVENLPVGAVNTVEIPFGRHPGRDLKEKALFRLVLLGLVEDYAVNWRLRRFEARVRRATPSDIRAAFGAYLRQYKFEAFAEQRTRDLPLDSLDEALEVALERMIDFVYDEIVAKRKQALTTMAELCRSFSSDEAFREAVLAYLQESEFTPILKKWIQRSFNEIGLDGIREVLDGVASLEEAKRLVGTTRRMLDEAPNHVALRLLSAAARLRSAVESDESGLQEAIAALRATSGDPTLTDAAPVVLTLVEEAERHRPALATPILRTALRTAGTPHLARAYLENRRAWPADPVAREGLGHLLAAGAASSLRQLQFHRGLSSSP